MLGHRSLAHATTVTAITLTLALAACGAPAQPGGQGLRTVQATVAPHDEPVLGASLVLLDGAVVTTADLAESFDGVWLGAAAGLGAGGAVSIGLPAGADLPPSLLYPAADLLDPNWIDLDCALEVSTPASVTPVVLLDFMSFPGVTALTANGAAFTIVTAQPYDLEDDSDIDEAAFVTFTHSTAATSVATPTGGCSVEGVAVSVDVALVAGWNQLAWSVIVERDPVTLEIIGLESVHLGNDATSPIHVAVLPEYLWEEFGGMKLATGGTLRR